MANAKAQCPAAIKMDSVYRCIKNNLHSGPHKAQPLATVTPDPTKGVFAPKLIVLTWWF